MRASTAAPAIPPLHGAAMGLAGTAGATEPSPHLFPSVCHPSQMWQGIFFIHTLSGFW